jgi:hypothetical protein
MEPSPEIGHDSYGKITDHCGGSVRGYRELLGPLTISAKAKPFGSQAVSLCIR